MIILIKREKDKRRIREKDKKIKGEKEIYPGINAYLTA